MHSYTHSHTHTHTYTHSHIHTHARTHTQEDLKRHEKGLEPFLKLLYLTPERVVKDQHTKDILNDLYVCVCVYVHVYMSAYKRMGA